MNTAMLSSALAIGRLAYGAALVVRPAAAGSVWIGGESARPATVVSLRALGVRDAALGAGTLASGDDPGRLRTWLAAGAVSDLVDLVATLAGGDAVPKRSRIGTAIVASGAFAANAALYASLDR